MSLTKTNGSPCGLKCWSWNHGKKVCATCIQKPLTLKDIQELEKLGIIVI